LSFVELSFVELNTSPIDFSMNSVVWIATCRGDLCSV
jgi:hypothetical protein